MRPRGTLIKVAGVVLAAAMAGSPGPAHAVETRLAGVDPAGANAAATGPAPPYVEAWRVDGGPYGVGQVTTTRTLLHWVRLDQQIHNGEQVAPQVLVTADRAGRTLWTRDVRESAWVGASEDLLVVGDGPGILVGLAPGDGRELWRHDSGVRGMSAPVVAAGLVLVAQNNTVLALDAATGARRWRTAISGVSYVGRPAVAGGTAYTGSACGMHALDLASGAVRHATAPGPCDSAHATWVGLDDGGRAHVTLADTGPTGRVFQYQADSGARIGSAYAGDPPALGRGRLFTPWDGTIQSYSWRNGAAVALWTGATDSPGTPLLLGDHLLAGTELGANGRGCLRALDARTGVQAWSATMVSGDTPLWVDRPVPAGDLLLVPHARGLVALRSGGAAAGDGTCPAAPPRYAPGWDPSEPLAPWPGTGPAGPPAPGANGAPTQSERRARVALAGTWTGSVGRGRGRHRVRLVVRRSARTAAFGTLRVRRRATTCAGRLTLRSRRGDAFVLRSRRTSGARRRCAATARVSVRLAAPGRLVVRFRATRGGKTLRAVLRRSGG